MYLIAWSLICDQRFHVVFIGHSSRRKKLEISNVFSHTEEL